MIWQYHNKCIVTNTQMTSHFLDALAINFHIDSWFNVVRNVLTEQTNTQSPN